MPRRQRETEARTVPPGSWQRAVPLSLYASSQHVLNTTLLSLRMERVSACHSRHREAWHNMKDSRDFAEDTQRSWKCRHDPQERGWEQWQWNRMCWGQRKHWKIQHVLWLVWGHVKVNSCWRSLEYGRDSEPLPESRDGSHWQFWERSDSPRFDPMSSLAAWQGGGGFSGGRQPRNNCTGISGAGSCE